jgi:NAD(P)-dependent dehydrogenase (short-subunit alcohol dehydrogenase family)
LKVFLPSRSGPAKNKKTFKKWTQCLFWAIVGRGPREEIGHRGVSVNSIVPTAIEGVSVYGDGVSAEFRNFIKSFRPTQQMGRPSDVANVGEYRAGDLATFVSGQHLIV